MKIYLVKYDIGLGEGDSVVYVSENKDAAFSKVDTHSDEIDNYHIDVWEDGKIIGTYHWNYEEDKFKLDLHEGDWKEGD